MNQDTKDMLNILAAEDGPVNGTLLKHRRKRWCLGTVTDLADDVLGPMIRTGLITQTVHNGIKKYQITEAGIKRHAAPDAKDEAPQVAEPRTRPFVHWDGIMRWDAASERGCHRGIARVGVAC